MSIETLLQANTEALQANTEMLKKLFELKSGQVTPVVVDTTAKNVTPTAAEKKAAAAAEKTKADAAAEKARAAAEAAALADVDVNEDLAEDESNLTDDDLPPATRQDAADAVNGLVKRVSKAAAIGVLSDFGAKNLNEVNPADYAKLKAACDAVQEA